MERDVIITKLVAVMQDTFDDDDVVYSDDLTAADVEAWDSLSNIRFMVAVEQAFGVRLSSAEMEGLTKVGDLVNLLESRC